MMTRRGMLLFSLALGCLGPVAAAAARRRRTPGMVEAAKAFLDSLEPAQRSRALMDLNDTERLNWNYVPIARKGLPLAEMSESQRKLAMELLRTGLSERGFSKAETIRQLELVLREMENGNPGRDPDRYFFTIFGQPAHNAAWGWRYEGHHCSQNWTIVRNRAISSTPQFFGSNPAEVLSGPMRGTRVLAAEEDLARALVKSLDETQKKDAVLDEPVPGDIITGSKRQAGILEQTGIPYSHLRPDQQGMMLAILEEYAGAQTPDRAQERLQKIREAGIDQVRFAWIGPLERGHGHYYRIQGSTFLIEYDNTQNNANHIHAVWRDFAGDFGQDVLAAHYRDDPHHAT